MPIVLPPVSRRRFVAGSLASAAALLMTRGSALAAPATRNPNRLSLLSDTHINRDPNRNERNTNMTRNLQTVVEQLLEINGQPGAPSALLINGDLAHHTGEAADYEQFFRLIQPLREAGLPLHLGLGNHDHRARFWKAVEQSEAGAVAQRHVSLLKLPRVDWLILDSLDKVNATPGELGEEQLRWLDRALSGRSNRPAVVMVHHHPDPALMTDSTDTPSKISGLTDTRPLIDLLRKRRRAKALLFGHRHVWERREIDGLHLVNLPAVAYVFREPHRSAWVDCHIEEKGMRLEVRCVNPADSLNGDTAELRWR